jgi:hypothetical protein
MDIVFNYQRWCLFDDSENPTDCTNVSVWESIFKHNISFLFLVEWIETLLIRNFVKRKFWMYENRCLGRNSVVVSCDEFRWYDDDSTLSFDSSATTVSSSWCDCLPTFSILFFNRVKRDVVEILRLLWAAASRCDDTANAFANDWMFDATADVKNWIELKKFITKEIFEIQFLLNCQHEIFGY